MKKILFAFTAGVVVGVLYAPRKGVKTRRKISEACDNMKEGWSQLSDSIQDKMDSFKGDTEEVTNTANNGGIALDMVL